LDVPVRKANTYTVKLNAAGDVEKTLAEETVVEGESYVCGYPMYIVDNNNVAYEAPADTAGADGYYNVKFSEVAEDSTKTITYTKKCENVAFYVDLDGSTANYANTRASNGSAYDNKAYTSTETIEPGIYTFVIRGVNKNRNSSVKVGDKTVLDISTLTKDNWETKTIEDVEITTAGNVTLSTSGSTYDDYDTILAIKTADIPTDLTGAVEIQDAVSGTGDYADEVATPVIATFTPSALATYTNPTIVWTASYEDEEESAGSTTKSGSVDTTWDTFTGLTSVKYGLIITGVDLKSLTNASVTATLKNGTDSTEDVTE
jgi:hypothetical protein